MRIKNNRDQSRSSSKSSCPGSSKPNTSPSTNRKDSITIKKNVENEPKYTNQMSNGFSFPNDLMNFQGNYNQILNQLRDQRDYQVQNKNKKNNQQHRNFSDWSMRQYKQFLKKTGQLDSLQRIQDKGRLTLIIINNQILPHQSMKKSFKQYMKNYYMKFPLRKNSTNIATYDLYKKCHRVVYENLQKNQWKKVETMSPNDNLNSELQHSETELTNQQFKQQYKYLFDDPKIPYIHQDINDKEYDALLQFESSDLPKSKREEMAIGSPYYIEQDIWKMITLEPLMQKPGKKITLI